MRTFLSTSLALLVASSTAGCGVLIVGSYPLGMPFLRANSEATVSVQPLDLPVSTRRMFIDTSPLRVVCDTESRSERVQTTTQTTFDGVGRMVVAFMSLGEATFSAVSFANADQIGHPGGVVAGSLLAADALGALLYAILAPDVSHRETRVGPGTPEHTRQCPTDLALTVGPTVVPVGPDGSIAGDARPLFVALLHGGTVSLTSSGRTVDWTPDAADRCALATESSDPARAALCGLPEAAAPADAVTPLVLPSVPVWRPGRPRIEIQVGVPLALPVEGHGPPPGTVVTPTPR